MANKTPANDLAALLVPQAILVDWKASAKDEVLARLCKALSTAGLVKDEASVLAAVRAREDAGSTGCGSGVAVPHARVPGLDRIVLAVGILQTGIEFGAVDGLPVRIVFLVVGPRNMQDAYLRLLSQIAQLMKEEEYRSALLSCENTDAVLDLLRSM